MALFKNNLSVKQLLLGAFTLAVLIPGITIATLAFVEARNALKFEIEYDLKTRAIAVMDNVDRMMFERLQNVASWSQLEVMEDASIGDIDKRLSTFLADLKKNYNGVYSELYVIDQHNKIISSSEPSLINQTLKLKKAWERVSLNGANLELYAINDGKLPISTMVKNEFGSNHQYYLVADFNRQQITQVLNLAINGSSAIILRDKHQMPFANTKLLLKDSSYQTIRTKTTSQGFKNFKGLDWQLEIIKYRDDALAPINQLGLIILTLSIMTLLISFLIAIPVAKQITQPISKLTAFAKNFVASGVHSKAPEGGPEEVREMANAFTIMIADLERSQENLTRAAKLAVVGEMAAAMSHEVRTPLGIIRSSAQVLMREPKLTKEGKEVCGFVVSETERLNKLVSTLIDAAKPRALDLKPTEIVQIAKHTVALLQAEAVKKQIQLHLVVNTHLNTNELIFNIDAEQMTQVLLNLLLNAIQILPEQGQIWLTITPKLGYVQISVADDGPGVSEDKKDNVFDPFFSQRTGGIGLGLAIVKQIVIAHLGEIFVQKSPQDGAEFIIRIPYPSAYKETLNNSNNE
jgi:two-component system, NtrC family, sensor histidine kinase HydH